MQALSTSETSAYLCEATRRNIQLLDVMFVKYSLDGRSCLPCYAQGLEFQEL
jgi:hypothetical protein